MNLLLQPRILIYGITEPLGQVHTERMTAYGTAVVAGVSPGHGGDSVASVPVFDTVDLAVKSVGTIDVSVIFVPPYEVLDAALESIAAGIRQVVIVTAGMPPIDTVRLVRAADATETLILGPSSTGYIVPEQVLVGTYPVEFHRPGSIGVIGRSGTLNYEVALTLTEAGFGQSFCVGIGGDGILGSSFPQWLQILDEDDRTEAIVLVGELGGTAEEVAAQYIAEAIDKPVIAYVAGRYVPQIPLLGHTPFGHAPAVNARLSGIARQLEDQKVGTAQTKLDAFEAAGIPIAERLSDIPRLLTAALAAEEEVASSR